MLRYVTICAFLALSVPPLGAQGERMWGSRIRQLQAAYAPAAVDVDGAKVFPPRTLVVRKDGIIACPMRSLLIDTNTYWNGKVAASAPNIGEIERSVGAAPWPLSAPVAIQSETRTLTIGERVYLLKMQITRDSLIFYIRSCGPCDASPPNPAESSFWAVVTISLAPGYLTGRELNEVQQKIGEVFEIAATPLPPPPATGCQLSERSVRWPLTHR
jgi:hypothetical protein